MKWLMIQDEIDRIEGILADNPGDIKDTKMVARDSPPVDLSNGVATIQVQGPMLKNRNPILDFLGQKYTTYGDIAAQMDQAEQLNARRIDFVMDSPGGMVDGLYACMGRVKRSRRRTRTRITGTAASASYMLASQTDEIIADNDANIIGGLGVAAKVNVDPTVKQIANVESPLKRPDPLTEEGVAAIQGQLGDIYGVLVEQVAAGRNTTIENINRNYGRGAVMTARSALKAGMIDAVRPPIESDDDMYDAQTNQPATVAADSGEDIMNIEELKAKHGDLYREVFEAGKKAERDRVTAHLVLADASGDMQTAIEAINDGIGQTDSVLAKHHAAHMKRENISARQQEAPPAVGTADAPPAPTALEQLADELRAEDPELILEV